MEFQVHAPQRIKPGNTVSMDRVYTSLISSNDPPPCGPTKMENPKEAKQAIFSNPIPPRVSHLFLLLSLPHSSFHAHPVSLLHLRPPLPPNRSPKIPSYIQSQFLWFATKFFCCGCFRFTWKWWNNTSSTVFHRKPGSTRGKKLFRIE